jgi:hypothetical protein
MEGKQLHPTEEPDGTHVFTSAEVFQVAKERARLAIDPTKTGVHRYVGWPGGGGGRCGGSTIGTQSVPFGDR